MTQEERISRIWFVTFASSNAKRTLRRICRQAVDFGFAPSRVNAFSERDLAPEFFAKMELRLRKGVRGFGYWCWKPQIVLQALQRMPDGDEACRTWGEMKRFPIHARRDISYGWRSWIPRWVKQICWRADRAFHALDRGILF